MLVAALALVAGCSGGTAPAEALPVPQSAAAAFPVTITHTRGSTVIPAAPTRVVALGQGDVDAAIAVGGPLVGAVSDAYAADSIAPWLVGRLDPAKVTMLAAPDESGGSPDLERIAGLRPDLILATSLFGAEDVYDKLQRIAPTVIFPTDWNSLTWQDGARFVGKALGRSAEMHMAISSTEQRAAAARAAHPQLSGKTFSFSLALAADQIVTVNSTEDQGLGPFLSVGLTLPPLLAVLPHTAGPTGATISPEQLDLLNADGLFIAYLDPGVQAQVEANPVFRRMAAVEANRYFPIGPELAFALRKPSVLGLDWAYGQLEPSLTTIAQG